MAQNYLGQIADTNFESGNLLAARLNAYDLAHKSNQMGITRPPGITAGGIWSRDNQDGTYSLMLFDGSVDFEFPQASSNAVLTAGDYVLWPKGAARPGTLMCDGSAISRAVYSTLFAEIGTRYGAGDGSTTFNIPDWRGKFPRAWDGGAGNDPDAASRTDRGDGTTGDAVGTNQADEYRSHQHSFNDSRPSGSGTDGSGFIGFVNRSDQSRTTAAAGGNETRPLNMTLMICIKY